MSFKNTKICGAVLFPSRILDVALTGCIVPIQTNRLLTHKVLFDLLNKETLKNSF